MVEWGQFQYFNLNHKLNPQKISFSLTLNLRNKITQQNACIANKTNFFSGITMKFFIKKFHVFHQMMKITRTIKLTSFVKKNLCTFNKV